MNYSTRPASNLARPLMLALLALFLTATKFLAISLWGEVYVNGNWTRVVPGSNTDGRVLWSDSIGWYTDRVSRGEQAAVTCVTTQAGETAWTVATAPPVGSYRMALSAHHHSGPASNIHEASPSPRIPTATTYGSGSEAMSPTRRS